MLSVRCVYFFTWMFCLWTVQLEVDNMVLKIYIFSGYFLLGFSKRIFFITEGKANWMGSFKLKLEAKGLAHKTTLHHHFCFDRKELINAVSGTITHGHQCIFALVWYTETGLAKGAPFSMCQDVGTMSF